MPLLISGNIGGTGLGRRTEKRREKPFDKLLTAPQRRGGRTGGRVFTRPRPACRSNQKAERQVARYRVKQNQHEVKNKHGNRDKHFQPFHGSSFLQECDYYFLIIPHHIWILNNNYGPNLCKRSYFQPAKLLLTIDSTCGSSMYP